MSDQESKTESFVEFLAMRISDIREEETPWTRHWVEAMIINGEAALKNGDELSIERVIAPLITSLSKIEQAARYGLTDRQKSSIGEADAISGATEAAARGSHSAADDEQSAEEFLGFLATTQDRVPHEDAPGTRDWIERMLMTGETLSGAGKELSPQRMAALLIPTLSKIEQTARHGKVRPAAAE